MGSVMKAISSAIVILAATVLLAAGAVVRYSDIEVALVTGGSIPGVIGLEAWLVTVSRKDD